MTTLSPASARLAQSRFVYPVIHHKDEATTLGQADLAFKCGADGVFLISHDDRNSELARPACAIKLAHPTRMVGLNYLGMTGMYAMHRVMDMGLDMVWTDDPGVTSGGWTEEGADLAHLLRKMGTQHPDLPKLQPGFVRKPMFFGSVAFKYQPHDPMPELAAHLAACAGMIPTTSGSATGHAPTLEKAQVMSEQLAGGALAIASGMTPENVRQFLPYFTHYLVATGVSTDMHHFDEARLALFIRTVHGYGAGLAFSKPAEVISAA